MKHKIIRSIFALLALSLLLNAPRAQQNAPAAAKQSSDDRVALYQALLDLTNPWTVMCIAAHPDDEDGTSLIVMRRKYGAHTVSLFSTFGEGGQNAIGPELYQELGAIRVRETMAAAEIQGSEPYFMGMTDFGYSKSPDETFANWGHDLALSQMVLQIRKLRPSVIITNHSVTNNDHGHHQATARLVLEAFDAAADPKRFPDQLKNGVTAWQVQRLFVRVGRSNQAPAEAGSVVTIDPNERDPIRGVVYAEEALRALQKHATQGPWPKTFAEFTARFRSFSGQNAAPGQLPLIRYVLVREAKGADALSKVSHNFLEGLRPPAGVISLIASLKIKDRPLTEFIDERDTVLTSLLELRRSDTFSRIFREQSVSPAKCLRPPSTASPEITAALDLIWDHLNVALKEASGIKASLTAQNGGSVVGGEVEPFAIRIANNGSRPVKLEEVAFHYCVPVQLERGGPVVSKTLSPGQSITLPMPSLNWISALLVPKGIIWSSEVKLPIRFEKEAFTVEVSMDGTLASLPVNSQLTLLPDIEITNITPSTAVSTSGARDAKAVFSMQVKNNRSTPFNGRIAGYLDQELPGVSNNEVVLATTRVSLKPHETRQIKIGLPETEVKVTDGMDKTTLDIPYLAAFHAEEEAKSSPHWRYAGESSHVMVGAADAHIAPNLRIGYIRGFDYSLPDALASLRVESKELSVDEVKMSDLSRYTSIIVDNRVYESQPELIASNQKLLDFANAGGTLIVFYHKSNEWNPDLRRNRAQLAPYKLILGNERITDENAPITFLEPQHPLLNFPNKIGPDDFKDWIQERGLYYPREWDPQFHALLQSNDPGEAPLKGGLLVADSGRGHYIYSSMVWYRQLRAGVPGAYRMLANMISYGHP